MTEKELSQSGIICIVGRTFQFDQSLAKAGVSTTNPIEDGYIGPRPEKAM